MARYSRAILPGGMGNITLQVHTTGYQGKITKSAMVKSNDRRRSVSRIAVKAVVIPHIMVKPASRVTLRGVVGDDIHQVLQISSGDCRPLENSGIKSSLDRWIDYNIKRREDGRTYDLEVISKATEWVSTDGSSDCIPITRRRKR